MNQEVLISTKIENLANFYEKNLNITKEESVRKARMFFNQFKKPKKIENLEKEMDSIIKQLNIYYNNESSLPKLIKNNDIIEIRLNLEKSLIKDYNINCQEFILIKKSDFLKKYEEFNNFKQDYHKNVRNLIKRKKMINFLDKINFPFFYFISEKEDFQFYYFQIDNEKFFFHKNKMLIILKNFDFNNLLDKVSSVLLQDKDYLPAYYNEFRLSWFIFVHIYREVLQIYFKALKFLNIEDLDQSSNIN